MFRPIDVDEQQFQLKPMNCPFHCLVYKDELRSYRELPIRWAEMGTVYRYERSGSLHGLMRVRGFTQDDAHIFCLPEHLQAEIRGVLDLTESILRKFGFDSYSVMLSTRPPASIGSDNDWTAATNALIGALDDKGWSYSVDEGGGAFYGPKIDIKIRDAIGRLWQCSTIQCDFNLPQRFALEYVAADQSRQRPIMLHRAIFGSLERFFGILIENTAGDFPLWLAPVHLKLLPITDDVVPYCLETKARAKEFGIRVDVDPGLHRIGKQIRAAEMERIPVMAVVGAKERDNSELSLRLRGVGDVGTRPVDLIFESLRRAIDHGIRLEECLNATPTGKT
ncbi:thrS [Symbiodinium microadriaticum]|nr:thrS [Symbiodinium microadriaticum]